MTTRRVGLTVEELAASTWSSREFMRELLADEQARGHVEAVGSVYRPTPKLVREHGAALKELEREPHHRRRTT